MSRSVDVRLVALALVPLGAWAAAQQETRSTEERLQALEARYQAEVAPQPEDPWSVVWRDGLRFESQDKRYKFRIGGRFNYDVAFFDPDADTRASVESTTGSTKVRIEDGAEFRRARFELGGEVADRVEWAASYDFAGGRPSFRNLYAGLKDVAFGTNLRVGQFKEPFAFEQFTSSNYLPFMERSLKAALDPGFNAGILLFDAPLEQRMTWAIGAFRTGTDDGEISKGDGEWATTARVTGLPFHDQAGDDYVHLGLGLSRRSPTDDLVSFSSKPEANLAPAYVALSNLPAETVDLVGTEAAWVRGPLTVAAEYVLASVEAPSGATAEPTFDGYYLLAGWVLTGEHRTYRKTAGSFDAVRPASNAFGKEHGLGAWEVLARLSSLDLRDDGVDEGELTDITLGLSWYLNPSTRVMANYIMADLDPTEPAADGDTDILEFRVQFSF